MTWFARELLPQLRAAGSVERMAGGWQVESARVGAVEDRLTGSRRPRGTTTDRGRAPASCGTRSGSPAATMQTPRSPGPAPGVGPRRRRRDRGAGGGARAAPTAYRPVTAASSPSSHDHGQVAVQVGAQHLGAGRAPARPASRRGVAVVVVLARADQRQPRAEPGEEAEVLVARPVVRHLQHVGLQPRPGAGPAPPGPRARRRRSAAGARRPPRPAAPRWRRWRCCRRRDRVVAAPGSGQSTCSVASPTRRPGRTAPPTGVSPSARASDADPAHAVGRVGQRVTPRARRPRGRRAPRPARRRGRRGSG